MRFPDGTERFHSGGLSPEQQSDGSAEAFSRLYEISVLERFDDRLFDQMGETSDLRLRYVREHLDEIVV